jgi:hypothetical protein
VDFVGKLSVVKTDIVQATMCFKHDLEFSFLVLVCPESKLERSSHLLAFLVRDVSLSEYTPS